MTDVHGVAARGFVSGDPRTAARRPVPHVAPSPVATEPLQPRKVRAPLALAGIAFAACAARSPAARAEPGRVETFTVTMPPLGDRERTVRVYLPPGYDGETRFPVLYMQDAQQVFTPGPYGDWRVDETLDSLARAGTFGGVIVVAVDNGPQRWSEYGPWRNANMRAWIDSSWARAEEGGDGAAYVQFLVSTLKPMVDARYRTRTGAAHTGIGGSSMGGLVALYAGLTRPDVFGRVMSMSTAVWFAEAGGPWLSDNRLLRLIGERPVPRGLRVYLQVGTAERSRESDPDVRDADGQRMTYPRAYVEGSRAVVTALVARGLPAGQLRHVEDEGAPHNEVAWARRFGEAVRWLFE